MSIYIKIDESYGWQCNGDCSNCCVDQKSVYKQHHIIIARIKIVVDIHNGQRRREHKDSKHFIPGTIPSVFS